MIRALFLLIFGTLFFTSLTTPFAFEAIIAINGSSPWPFSRVYDRVAMFWVLILLLVLRRSFSLSSLASYYNRSDVGRKFMFLVAGAALSFLTSMALLPLYVQGDVFSWKEVSGLEIFYRALKVVPAAIVISVIEESFFRVVFFQKCREHLSLIFAICVTSLTYAIVHFISPVKSWEYPGYSIFVGFEYLSAVAGRFQAPGVLPAAIGLFLVGAVLCFTIYRTRSLFLCIGLHAGWVLAVKMASFVTISNENYEFALGAGKRYFLVSKPLSWVLVILVGIVAVVCFRVVKNSRDAKTVENS